jgi:hypothetical protein
MLVMIGHAREIRHLYEFAVTTSEDFFKSWYNVNTVGDVDWVCLAPDRKVWKAPHNRVESLQIVQEAGKCDGQRSNIYW